MEILQVPRAYEDVYFEDPGDNPDAKCFRVRFDDGSADALLAKVGDALDRARGNERKAREAQTDEERGEAERAQARLIERTVEAFVGREGWEELLRVVGRGEPVDPARHIRVLGEVFAQLMVMLGRHVASERLTECGVRYARDAELAGEFKRRGKSGKGKKGRR